MRRLTLFLSLLLSCRAFSASLDTLVLRTDLWSLKQDEFLGVVDGRPYVWTSSAHDSARAANSEITLFNLPILESIARFEGGKLALIGAEIYARGDAGDIDKDKFEQLLHGAIDALNASTKVKFVARGKEAGDAVHAEGLVWQTPGAQYLLEYSFTKEVKSRKIPFRAEFVRLTVTPPQKAVSLLASASSTAQSKFSGLTHVKRDANSGDVYIADVPMVDQGQKGYCAVACTERVMRYYGVPVDENELAQIANTQTTGGTSADAMFDALKKLSARLRVRVHPIEQQDIRQLTGLISEYNRSAKKAGETPLPSNSRVFDVVGMYEAMKPEVLMDAKTRNKSELTRFEHAVQAHIDQGIPLVWSVVLLFPEKGVPQTGGGHMRLIIGYNDKTQEILYSDSWGAGHELKRMPLARAVTISTGLTSIEPI